MAERRSPRSTPLTQRVTLRLPADTATAWRHQAQAAELTLSDWVRRRVDGGHAVPAAKPRRRRRLRTLTADPELLQQLASLGSNMNQIARRVNGLGLDASNVIELLTELAAIQRELHRLAELPRYDPDDQGEEGEKCT